MNTFKVKQIDIESISFDLYVNVDAFALQSKWDNVNVVRHHWKRNQIKNDTNLLSIHFHMHNFDDTNSEIKHVLNAINQNN